jgi:hypothetical protein
VDDGVDHDFERLMQPTFKLTGEGQRDKREYAHRLTDEQFPE